MDVSTSPLSAHIGVEVTGVSGGNLVQLSSADQCRDLLERHGVVVYRDAGITDDQLIEFSAMLGQEASTSLLERLEAWATKPEVVLRHHWHKDDLVIWDNTGMLHRAAPFQAMSVYEGPQGPVEYPDQFDMLSLFGAEPSPELAPGTWMHVNPQRIDLGRTGLVFRPEPSAQPETDPSVLADVRQRLDLWSGTIHSSFTYAGEPVTVTTVGHHARPARRRRAGSGLRCPPRGGSRMRTPASRGSH